MTRTDFGSATEDYVFSYPRGGNASRTSIPLRDLGIHSPVYAWDWVTRKGEMIPAGKSLQIQYKNGWGYEVLAPIDQAGFALLGDIGKIVPLARKRFTSVSNHGELEATVAFASGEKSANVTGYAASAPHVTAAAGKISGLHFDPATHLFSFAVSPSSSGTAMVRIH
jgi:hypothetical protein